MNDFLNSAKEEVKDRVDQAAAKANKMKTHITEKANEVKERVVDTVEDGRHYVKRNPEKCAGIALGVGALLGAIIGFFTGRRK